MKTQEIIKFFQENRGIQFIGIPNYQRKDDNAIGNYTLNINLPYEKAKIKNRDKYINANKDEIINQVSLKTKLAKDIVEAGFENIKNRAIANTEKDKEKRTAQSQAQTDAYIPLSKCIKIHKDTGDLHISGRVVQYKQIVAGDKPKKKKNKQDRTIAQDHIKKILDIQENYRTFKISKIKNINVQKDTIIVEGEAKIVFV